MWPSLSGRLALLSAKLGRCVRCMRLSVRLAAAGWIAVGVAYLVDRNIRSGYLLLPWAVGFSALWCAHIVAFAARAVGGMKGSQATGGQADASVVPSQEGLQATSRRQVLVMLARAGTIAVAASLSLPFTVLAFSRELARTGTSMPTPGSTWTDWTDGQGCWHFDGRCTGGFWWYTRQCVRGPSSQAPTADIVEQCCQGWFQFPWIKTCKDSLNMGCSPCLW